MYTLSYYFVEREGEWKHGIRFLIDLLPQQKEELNRDAFRTRDANQIPESVRISSDFRPERPRALCETGELRRDAEGVPLNEPCNRRLTL